MKRSPVSGLNCPSRIAPASSSRPSWCSCRPRQISKMRMRPAVSVALRRRDAVGGQAQRVVDVVEHGARLAAPLLGEALARPVGRADAGARRLLGQLERVVVAPVDDRR